MFEHRSLKLPIALGVIMIVLVVVLIVGWVMLTVIGVIRETENAPMYWTLLSVGSTVLAAVLLGIVMYLTLSVKAISLNRRQSNFVDSVTHELKSPIASLKLCLQTLTRHSVDDRQPAGLPPIHAGRRGTAGPLDQPTARRGTVAKSPSDGDLEAVDVAAVIRGCIDTVCLRYRVDADAVELDLKPVFVQARRVDIDLIFRNLIDNAIKYAGNPPQVTVDMESIRGDRLQVRVTDNGRGIPRGQRRHIFGRFVRLGSELERDKQGTGLGLHIVHTLVRQLRGRIRVRDRRYGCRDRVRSRVADGGQAPCRRHWKPHRVNTMRGENECRDERADRTS